ncbi:MAG: RecB-like helicase [Sulfurimonas sp.]|nr:MAG: RecB-like helicase [Sulfurimonas sp.]
MAFQPFLAYEASAGSGKTFMLVVRYLSLLFMKKEPSKILALTFTNKAANEMLERIVTTLETLHLRQNGELKEISRMIEQSPEAILAQQPEVLQRLLQSDLKVMTIDKFLAIILRKFSLHVGIMPTFTTHESQHDMKVLSRFLQELFDSKKIATLIDLTLINNTRLTDTTALLDRLYLLRGLGHTTYDEPRPYRHLSQEILEEVATLRGLVNAQEGASTTAKKSMDVESLEALLSKNWYRKESLNYRTYAKCYTPEMDEVLQRIQQKLNVYFHRKEQHYFQKLFALVDTYEASKLHIAKEDGELGFDDVSVLVHTMLSLKGLSRDFLYFRLDSEIDHLLLDEFQDTSTIQFDILAPIIDEICSGAEEKSLFFVGDVKQSIYRFRGGVKELFYEVARRYRVDVEVLRTNYRSAAAVVTFVNRTFQDVIENYTPQQIKADAPEGYVEVIENDDLLEAAFLHVNRLLEQGVQPTDIALLCATNSDGLLIETRLKNEGIAVVTETTSKLIHQPSVQALIAYLKYLYFQEEIDARNFFSLINRPPEPIAIVSLERRSLSAHLKSVIAKYGLFSGDLNPISFLETLYESEDIEAFLFEYERIDTAAVHKEHDGVRVLTVHKSKGLEFEHVIVLDRLSQRYSNRSRLLFEYEGIKLKRLFLRQKGRETLDDAYRNALQKDDHLCRDDHLNMLYVAFTRAKTSLLVIQKSKHSQFENLNLDVQQQGRLHVTQLPPKQPLKVVPITYTPLHLGRQEVPSTPVEEEPENLYAIDFGLALHYALELCDLHLRESVSGAIDSVKNRFGDRLAQQDFDAIEERIVQLLATPQFQELITGSCRKEQPISYENELYYIDLLVERRHDIVVIDYKSSRRFEARHHAQVRRYQKAVETIMGQNVHACVVYLLEEGIEIVSA